MVGLNCYLSPTVAGVIISAFKVFQENEENKTKQRNNKPTTAARNPGD